MGGAICTGIYALVLIVVLRTTKVVGAFRATSDGRGVHKAV